MLEATSLYKLVAERGTWISLSRWALESYYLKGLCIDSERHQRAHSLWWQASEQGNKHVALLIGDAYYYGQGTERDYDCAADAYMHAKLQLNALETDSAVKLPEEGLRLLLQLQCAVMSDQPEDDSVPTY
nr:hypothetical protein [Tanacetum cinerariifolium]